MTYVPPTDPNIPPGAQAPIDTVPNPLSVSGSQHEYFVANAGGEMNLPADRPHGSRVRIIPGYFDPEAGAEIAARWEEWTADTPLPQVFLWNANVELWVSLG